MVHRAGSEKHHARDTGRSLVRAMRSPDDARHATSAIVRDAGNVTHTARDVDHRAPRAMRAARAICHSLEAVLQGAQNAVQRTRCAVQATRDALH